ncbi:hypothetical protein B0H11DRAFT_480380 [Mycena galericulata]|nr:hypothetical protein B0H11DRAFT_480380 [Mycena galericulata]
MTRPGRGAHPRRNPSIRLFVLTPTTFVQLSGIFIVLYLHNKGTPLLCLFSALIVAAVPHQIMNRKSTKSSARSSAKSTVDCKTRYDGGTASATFHSGYRKSETPDEEIPLPESARERSLTPKEAEVALRHLFDSGDNNTDLNSSTFTADSEAFVRGFRDGIRLMPHQIPARAWMRDREDSTMKKAGGILADEMGLGKTIQLVTRVVDDSLRSKGPARTDGSRLHWSSVLWRWCSNGRKRFRSTLSD